MKQGIVVQCLLHAIYRHIGTLAHYLISTLFTHEKKNFNCQSE